ncbi:hypothetical protein IW261DRAFT_1605443 [Armillaria novae-zelandiae]|uniref:Metallothionein n=1 Tax=Armillaria novae-zelandiae TaxID=153914 RepID=A0AA39PFN0_9AGAR|nr:hypothetical protein IW261DRAFT_1605443 [Armillaria novae-zelandiae]
MFTVRTFSLSKSMALDLYLQTFETPVSQNGCGSTSCNCGASCACKPGECKC